MGDDLFTSVSSEKLESYVSTASEDTQILTDQFEDEPKEGIEKLKSIGKLFIIIVFYAVAFTTMVQLGFWLASIHHFHPMIVPTDIITWMVEKWKHGIWWDMVTKGLLVDMALLLGFFAQHSLMSQRVLDGTSYWMYAHYIYKIDRPIYVLTTAIALQGILQLWHPLPVVIWTMSWINNYYMYVHIFAWIAIYGTCIMMDLPDLVGFNQVVISSPTMIQKSPELQMMYRTQRHMGFLPFMIMFLIHPQMTLDRFVLTVFLTCYMYTCWSSPSCYEYACRMKEIKKRRL